jgi:hypothetical protein
MVIERHYFGPSVIIFGESVTTGVTVMNMVAEVATACDPQAGRTRRVFGDS